MNAYQRKLLRGLLKRVRKGPNQVYGWTRMTREREDEIVLDIARTVEQIVYADHETEDFSAGVEPNGYDGYTSVAEAIEHCKSMKRMLEALNENAN